MQPELKIIIVIKERNQCLGRHHEGGSLEHAFLSQSRKEGV